MMPSRAFDGVAIVDEESLLKALSYPLARGNLGPVTKIFFGLWVQRGELVPFADLLQRAAPKVSKNELRWESRKALGPPIKALRKAIERLGWPIRIRREQCGYRLTVLNAGWTWASCEMMAFAEAVHRLPELSVRAALCLAACGYGAEGYRSSFGVAKFLLAIDGRKRSSKDLNMIVWRTREEVKRNRYRLEITGHDGYGFSVRNLDGNWVSAPPQGDTIDFDRVLWAINYLGGCHPLTAVAFLLLHNRYGQFVSKEVLEEEFSQHSSSDNAFNMFRQVVRLLRDALAEAHPNLRIVARRRLGYCLTSDDRQDLMMAAPARDQGGIDFFEGRAELASVLRETDATALSVLQVLRMSAHPMTADLISQSYFDRVGNRITPCSAIKYLSKARIALRKHHAPVSISKSGISHDYEIVGDIDAWLSGKPQPSATYRKIWSGKLGVSVPQYKGHWSRCRYGYGR